MDTITSAIMVPHPPIILPVVGKGEEKKIEDITKAYEKAAGELMDSNPDTIVIISPHAPSYYDYMQISSGSSAQGDMGAFRDFEDSFDIEYDSQLVDEICQLAYEEGLPAGTLGQQNGELDHGTMVPLYFLQKAIPNKKFVRIGIGGPSALYHYKLGTLIQKAAEKLGRKIAVVGSGDLSHCQKEGTHYGFKECGPKYDEKIMDIMSKADFLDLIEIPEQESEEAMGCGQKSFAVMAGAMDGYLPKAENLGHSAEFGVGYGVVSYTDLKKDNERKLLQKALEKEEEKYKKKTAQEDDYVKLARNTINEYILQGDILQSLKEYPAELFTTQAGCFVSLHKDGQLRGCIGTTAPTKPTLAEEIMANAIKAATQDPRFPQVQPWEVKDLDINVDVLKKPEPIECMDELDVKKYGVIATKGSRRGLLLPDLEGVNTTAQQVSIAKQKAGLDPDEADCTLERFEVIRHL